ncbi:methyl-accepting chemotaxis sensory transducer with TarH sensor [Rhizobium sp. RU20A]|uniref:methyl-accepting chemotaxis protein n=1 Tax=Rhizobium sp. RU20A TaxID=1907412 RepID=UPI000955D173|nr:methyl-accepting chemotaxis protein [Rhizobium sp. RU20A]SIQ34367.1 methyl-accepting chemotaxis sensory transducer with TarH sensor [Rhizobium sp. RU20A]
MLRHIRLVPKIVGMLALLGACGVGGAVVSGFQLQEIDANYSHMLGSNQESVLYTVRSNRATQTFRATVAEMIFTKDQEQINDLQAQQDSTLADIDKFFTKALAALPDDAGLKQLKTEAHRVVHDVCLPISKRGGEATTEAAIAAVAADYYSQCQPQLVTLTKLYATETNRLVEGAKAQSAILTASARSATIWLVSFMTLVSAAFVTLAALLVKKGVTGPIANLRETMSRLAGGDLSAPVTDADRRDEIGDMAKTVQIFKDNALRAEELEAQARRERDMSESERARNRELERDRAEKMATATGGIDEALKHLARGDLTYRLERPFSEEFEGLRQNFNAAIAQLTETLRAVSTAAATIDSGTQELSVSANDLSKRTEQQAAALEETAAALDEITSNVASSTKRTEEARHKAEQANESARRSGAIMTDAVNAMQRIEKSSSEIGNIISVIDEIAFQTNLLALNAGVEAARAGEAGKGFAVVAQEVRELAQRSAKAAKEIKDLIKTSADEVATGVRLVTETGSALQVIESHVVDINEQLNAIATAAKEQSVGLLQVNTAVNQMDQSTQQNAAMVEQSTAASSALANEADRLRNLIGQFRTDTGASAGRPAATAPTSAARQMVTRVAEAFTPKKRAAGGGSAGGWDEF